MPRNLAKCLVWAKTASHWSNICRFIASPTVRLVRVKPYCRFMHELVKIGKDADYFKNAIGIPDYLDRQASQFDLVCLVLWDFVHESNAECTESCHLTAVQAYFEISLACVRLFLGNGKHCVAKILLPSNHYLACVGRGHLVFVYKGRPREVDQFTFYGHDLHL